MQSGDATTRLGGLNSGLNFNRRIESAGVSGLEALEPRDVTRVNLYLNNLSYIRKKSTLNLTFVIFYVNY